MKHARIEEFDDIGQVVLVLGFDEDGPMLHISVAVSAPHSGQVMPVGQLIQLPPGSLNEVTATGYYLKLMETWDREAIHKLGKDLLTEIGKCECGAPCSEIPLETTYAETVVSMLDNLPEDMATELMDLAQGPATGEPNRKLN